MNCNGVRTIYFPFGYTVQPVSPEHWDWSKHQDRGCVSTLHYTTLAKLAGKAKVMIGSSRGEERGYDSLQSRLNVVLFRSSVAGHTRCTRKRLGYYRWMCLLYPTQSTCWNIVNLYWKNRCCCLRLLEIRMDLFQSYINLCCFSFIAIYLHYFKGQFLKKLPHLMIGKLVWQALCNGQICLWASYNLLFIT